MEGEARASAGSSRVWDERLQGRGESTHCKGTDFYVNMVFSFQEPPLKPHILVKRLFLLI